ncbi:hypothetical protein PTSG_04212 [Salpingoeca rosetta]|uniref:Phosphodiester glycosidase domain-containing protein n=1 Tax=Salpingoeca rosetta (strain ATCC 50818 / BSB-021) TaxID=946362 RepID=F2U6X2_SALR5|nr:uncharacterized protein PTSG_04212 [Salpingoeca rosetta]EGD83604.1 hypothetical protein PTSG_04212 [Salpingoeca rosetta]|eukprot:XP_004995108.1 hypothetical protein PTSG_04212 [Salpingoeca rosetta]
MKLVCVSLVAVLVVVVFSGVGEGLLVPPTAPSGPTDVDQLPWPNATSQPLNVKKLTGHYNSTGRPYTAYLAILNNLSKFHFGLVPDGCKQHTTTQDSAQKLDCVYATNGGFFAFTPPACEGNIIIDSKTIQLPATGNCVFGLTENKRTVVGFVDGPDIAKFRFTQLLSGSGWLVRKGKSYVNKSRDISPTSGFVTEKAPRTAVGVRADGTLISLVVDGVEATKQGPDLFELAELLVAVGAYEAMNLDGGGSTTAVYHGQVFNVPTCHDTPTPVCQRDVTTITCIKP